MENKRHGVPSVPFFKDSKKRRKKLTKGTRCLGPARVIPHAQHSSKEKINTMLRVDDSETHHADTILASGTMDMRGLKCKRGGSMEWEAHNVRQVR